MDRLVAQPGHHEGLFWKDGYFTIEDKPGLGVEINADVAKAIWLRGDLVGIGKLFLMALMLK